MSNYKCENCHCTCHCNDPLHAHHYDGDLCTCENCKCKKQEDLSYENNGVVNNTNECK